MSNPDQKDEPRMRMRGGKMVDINQPWASLDPAAKADNKIAAACAYAAVKRHPGNREKAAAYVHKQWMKRNRADPNQPTTTPHSAMDARSVFDNLRFFLSDSDRGLERLYKIIATRKLVSEKVP